MGAGVGARPTVVLVSAAASGAGKTAWVEALVRYWSGQGRRLAVVKHHPHGSAHLRAPGKDTARAMAAGAAPVALVEPGQVALTTAGRTPADDLDSAVRAVTALGPVDIVLAEGFRAVPGDLRLWVGAGAPPPGDRVVVRADGPEAEDAGRVALVAERLVPTLL